MISKLNIVFLALSCCFFACANEPKPMDPTQLERLTQLREHLKKELGDKYQQPIAKATSEQLKRGAELYPQVCAACHGGRGDGAGKVANGLIGNPTSFTDPEQAAFFSEQARLHIIRKGIPGTPMMGWENVLNEQDILSLYLYIRSLIEE